MSKLTKEEFQKRIAPYLVPINSSNKAPKPTLKDFQNNNYNLRLLDNNILNSSYDVDHASVQYRLEGAMDQLEMVLGEMTDGAELELFHDYPEISKVFEALHQYKRAGKTPDNVKSLYNLTRYLDLPRRTFELETPKEKNELTNKLKDDFEKFLQMEERIAELNLSNRIAEQNALDAKKANDIALEEQKQLDEQIRLKNEEAMQARNQRDKVRSHPYYIQPPKPVFGKDNK